MSVVSELLLIKEQNDGMLRPADVVEYAKDPKTELHSHFTWDDGEAGHQYRLWQARQAIRVHVTVIQPDTAPVRAFVSLRQDRHSGNGYRPIVDVLTNDEWRKQLLDQAMREAQAWRRKYHALKELVPVFEAIDHVSEVPVATQLAEAAD